jgi:hypothetical protein
VGPSCWPARGKAQRDEERALSRGGVEHSFHEKAWGAQKDQPPKGKGQRLEKGQCIQGKEAIEEWAKYIENKKEHMGRSERGAYRRLQS